MNFFLIDNFARGEGTEVKNPSANAGDTGGSGSTPGSGGAPGGGNGNPLQYSCMKSMDRGAWWAVVHGVTKNPTRLSAQHTKTWRNVIVQKRLSPEADVWWCHLKLGFETNTTL